jgi:hypothetical protein
VIGLEMDDGRLIPKSYKTAGNGDVMLLSIAYFLWASLCSASLAVAKTHQEQARRINNLMFIFVGFGFC